MAFANGAGECRDITANHIKLAKQRRNILPAIAVRHETLYAAAAYNTLMLGTQWNLRQITQQNTAYFGQEQFQLVLHKAWLFSDWQR